MALRQDESTRSGFPDGPLSHLISIDSSEMFASRGSVPRDVWG